MVTARGKRSAATATKQSVTAKGKRPAARNTSIQQKEGEQSEARPVVARGKRSAARESRVPKRPRLQEQVTESRSDETSESGTDQESVNSELNPLIDTNLDNISDDELPRECPLPASGSVTAHLDDRTLQKIVQGRYIQLSTLLPSNKTSTKLTFDSQTGALEAKSSSKKLFNFSEWLDAFLIYATVRGSAHASEAVHMYKYIQTVKRIKDRGGNFVRYDENFRAKYKGLPTIPWQTIDSEEMLWACGDPSYVPFEKYIKIKEGTKTFKARDRHTFRSTRAKSKCFYYNRGQYCDKKRCNYLHECRICGGPHPAAACNQQTSTKPTNNGKQ